jgi:hypothetical protein
MNAFSTWCGAGLGHILDPSAFDHLLFVALLATANPPAEWKKLLFLVTAFTLGHALTLLLAVSTKVNLPSAFIEFGIALSIVGAGLYNAVSAIWARPSVRPVVYFITCFFGLLHGLGFSLALRSMLAGTHEVILPLLYFNLGIEAGQLLMATAVLLISLFLTTIIHIPFKYFKFFSACIITLVALKISMDRLPHFFF